jgi:hypothetical protein
MVLNSAVLVDNGLRLDWLRKAIDALALLVAVTILTLEMGISMSHEVVHQLI